GEGARFSVRSRGPRLPVDQVQEGIQRRAERHDRPRRGRRLRGSREASGELWSLADGRLRRRGGHVPYDLQARDRFRRRNLEETPGEIEGGAAGSTARQRGL